MPRRIEKKSKNFPEWLISVLEKRGIKEEKIKEFLEPEYGNLLSPFSFKNMHAAVEKICCVLSSQEKVVIYGDYDVDGITATALLFDVLSAIGVKNLECYIPHREEEGYGLNADALRKLRKGGAKLIIAVDCGISSKEIIDSEEFQDLDFIVCDHHTIDEKQIPQRSINLHVNLVEDEIEPQDLSACGLAFFWAVALQERFSKKLPKGQEKWLLDLVALSTICDIVPLVGQNRILTKYGLIVLSKTKRPGLLALMRVASLNPKEINSYSVGFVLGPRLNAAGRLEHAQKSLNLLLTKDEQEAKRIALELTNLNAERQRMCDKILAEAIAEIENTNKKNHAIFLLSNKNWPRGVVGIIASRLSESYFKPVIVFEHNGEMLHGSARSIEGFDITEALSEVSDHIVKYGGHSKAAGISLLAEKFVIFQDKMLEITRRKIKETEINRELLIDAVIDTEEIDESMLDLIQKLEPFGYGNRNPIFAIKKAEIVNPKKVGSDGNHLKFNVKVVAKKTSRTKNPDLEDYLNAIFFNYQEDNFEEAFWDNVANLKYDLAFTLKYNIWNSKKNIELRVIDLKASEN